nr:MAG: hypothetical protein 2 [Hangzhou hepe-like virus 1]
MNTNKLITTTTTTKKMAPRKNNPSRKRQNVIVKKTTYDQLIRRQNNKRNRIVRNPPKRNNNRRIAKAGLAKNPYAMCRLMPFHSGGRNLGIPDGTDVRRILMDHRMQNTFVIGSSGTMNIAITPALPSSVWFNSQVFDTTFSVNGQTFPYHTGNQVLMFPLMQPEWREGTVRLYNTEGRFDDADPIYNSTKSRIVTVGWSILYTGTSLNNSGIIRVNKQQIGVGDLQPNMASFSVWNSQSGTDKNWNPGQVQIRVLDQTCSFYASNTSDTRTFPLKSGCHGVLKHSSDEYEWCNITPNLCFLALPSNENVSALPHLNIGGEGQMAHWPQVSSFDNGWSSTLLTISGATPGSSFVLDTIYCVEYTPSISSQTYPLAKQGPPKNDNLVQRVDKAATAQPVANVGSANDITVGDIVVPLLKTGARVASAFV